MQKHVELPSEAVQQQYPHVSFLCMQVLVEAETLDGARHSILLQNAETVRLIGPSTSAAAPVASATAAAEHSSLAGAGGPSADSNGAPESLAELTVGSVEDVAAPAAAGQCGHILLFAQLSCL